RARGCPCVSAVKPRDSREPPDWLPLPLPLGAASARGRRPPLPTSAPRLRAAGPFSPSRARRDLWFVTLAGCAILASAWPRSVSESDRFSLTRLRVAGLAAILALAAVLLVRVRDLSAARLHEVVASQFPVKPAEFVAAKDHPG